MSPGVHNNKHSSSTSRCAATQHTGPTLQGYSMTRGVHNNKHSSTTGRCVATHHRAAQARVHGPCLHSVHILPRPGSGPCLGPTGRLLGPGNRQHRGRGDGLGDRGWHHDLRGSLQHRLELTLRDGRHRCGGGGAGGGGAASAPRVDLHVLPVVAGGGRRDGVQQCHGRVAHGQRGHCCGGGVHLSP